MSDKPLSTAELESLALKCDEHTEFLACQGARPAWGFDFPGTLARVCRQALAQAGEVERLRTWKDLWDRIFAAIGSVEVHDSDANPAVEALLDWIDRTRDAESEVERLRAEIERLRGVVRGIAATAGQDVRGVFLPEVLRQIEAAARADLGKEPPC